MDATSELEQLRRSIACMPPRRPDAIGREDALRLIADLQASRRELDDLRRRLRELGERT